MCQKEATVLDAVDLEQLKANRDERLETERAKAAEQKVTEEVKRKKRIKIALIFCCAVLIASVALICVKQVIIPGNQYAHAEELLEAGDYDGVQWGFESLGDYKDAAQRAAYDVPYRQAEALEQAGLAAQAAIAFGKIGDYQGARARSVGLWEQVVTREIIVTNNDFLGYTVGLKSDGTVVATGIDSHGQCDVGGWTNIKLPS